MPSCKVEKTATTSKDIFADELAKFSALFPQFVSEGKIDFEALKQFLADKDALADDKDRYAFSWAGKNDAFKAISRPSFATLKPQKSASVDFDNSENLFIEGDNLEVLKLLQKHYHHKIKMIYIDPPYNTGKDFIYKDNFTEGKSDYFERIGATKNGIKLEANSDAHGRYHSQWLSMMYPRLFLAKQLLKDDGVIFISIDDNEQHHLKMLMNEVFGEDNCFADMVVIRAEGGGLAKKVIKGHDNLLVYAKSLPYFKGIYKPKDIRGKIIVKNEKKYWIEEDWLRKEFGKYGTLCYEDIASIKGINKKNEIDLGLEKDNYRLIKKGRKHIVGRLRAIDEDGSKFYSILKHLNKNGIDSLKTINMETLFDYPKPISLIKEIVQGATLFSKDGIILDFFAGSATTGHAVMDLNKQDGGNRKFILVQIPESVDEKSAAAKAGYKTISEIGIERLKRAIDKNNYPTGFKVFSLAPSHYTINQSYDGDDEQALLTIEKSAIKNPLTPNFDPLDLAYEIALKQGFPLTSNIEKKDDFYTIIDLELERTLIITLAKKINTSTIETLKLTTDDILVCLDSALTDTQKVNFSRNFNLRVI